MKQGIYRICAVKHDGDQVTKHHLGRIAVVNGHTQVLEDTRGGMLHRSFPDGVVDERKANRWTQMSQSPYFEIKAEGLHDEEPEPMEQPKVPPDEVFDLVDSAGRRRTVEAYGENIFIDGVRQHPRDVQEMQRLIHSGELHLIPKVLQ